MGFGAVLDSRFRGNDIAIIAARGMALFPRLPQNPFAFRRNWRYILCIEG